MILFLIVTYSLNPRKRRFPTSYQLWLCVSSIICTTGIDLAVLVGGTIKASFLLRWKADWLPRALICSSLVAFYIIKDRSAPIARGTTPQCCRVSTAREKTTARGSCAFCKVRHFADWLRPWLTTDPVNEKQE
jgi:hypothetical protein